MIRSLGEQVGEAVAESVGRVVGLAQEQESLPADLLESEEVYLVVFDAPGAEPGDVQVKYEDGAVEVRVDRFRAFHEGFDMVFPGRGLSLDGRKSLPPDAVVDAEAASATLRENGTLAVELPKSGSVSAGTTDEAAESDGEATSDESVESDGESASDRDASGDADSDTDGDADGDS